MKRGFTLIELLVVVAIIAILAAMLLPALNRAREAAKTAACQAGMKNLGIAMSLYSADYGGYLCWHYHRQGPVDGYACNTYHWYELWTPYTDGTDVFHDPALAPLNHRWSIIGSTGDRADTYWCDYMWNLHALFKHDRDINDKGVSRDELPFPTSTVGLMCRRLMTCSWTHQYGYFQNVGPGGFATSQDGSPNDWPMGSYARPLRVHKGGDNLLFCDGHVSWTAPDATDRDWYMGSLSRHYWLTHQDFE